MLCENKLGADKVAMKATTPNFGFVQEYRVANHTFCIASCECLR